MAVKIRMTRTGGKNEVSYRVVATDSRSPRDGRYLEVLGWYDPKRQGVNFEIKKERLEHWLRQGAQISDTVASLLRKANRLPAEPTPPVQPVASEPQPA